MESAVIRPKAAAKYIGIGIASFWRLVKNDPTFPRTFRVGKMATGILRADLDAWLQQKREGK